MADKPVRGSVKAIRPSGPGWFDVDIQIEGTTAAVTHVVKGTEQGAGFNVGDTISFFPKMTRNNKAMAGGPRVMTAGPSPNQTGTAMDQNIPAGEKDQPPAGVSYKDASVCMSYAKDLVVATVASKIPLDADGEIDDTEILDRVKYLSEGLLSIVKGLVQ